MPSAPKEELWAKTACCCCSGALWCSPHLSPSDPKPGCCSVTSNNICCCLNLENDCALNLVPNALCRLAPCVCCGCDKDENGQCGFTIAKITGSCLFCYGMTGCTIVPPRTCIQTAGNCCCCDCRTAFPCTADVPCEVGLCGIMCKQAATKEEAPAAATMDRS